MGKIGDNLPKGFRIGFEGYAEEPVQGEEENYYHKERNKTEQSISSPGPGTEKEFNHLTVPPQHSYAGKRVR
jgi:hypothetical protein